ncbi:MAG: FGGY-family carbohydrate kinase [Armatimonadota bacterium]
MSILAVDIGTTGCTAIVYAPDGRVLGQGYRDYPLQHPAPGAMEVDAGLVLERTREAVRGAAEGAGWRGRVRVMSLSVQGESVVPVDAAGRILGPAMVALDSRPAEEAAWLDEQLGRARIQQITGLPLHSMHPLCKIRWLRRHAPGIAAKTAKYLGFDALFLQRLGLEPLTDHSLGGRTMLMELRGRRWSAELLEAAGLREAHLPALAPAGAPLGVIPGEIAREFRLPDGVQVVLGGHDQACAALGCGVMEPGMAMDAAGAVECLAPVLAEPVLNDAMLDGHYGCYPHVVADRYLTLAYIFSSGSLLSWYRDTLGDLEEQEAEVSGLDFNEILIGKAGSGISSVLVLPHFTATGTPWLDRKARGAIVGLSLVTSRSDIITGMLDGISYELRVNLDHLAAAVVPVDTLRLVGNGSQSLTLLQRKANIFNRPVEGVATPLPTCQGAAMLAGVGAGLYADLPEAVAAFLPPLLRSEPEPEAVAEHDEQYRLYQELYPALRPITQQLPGGMP